MFCISYYTSALKAMWVYLEPEPVLVFGVFSLQRIESSRFISVIDVDEKHKLIADSGLGMCAQNAALNSFYPGLILFDMLLTHI